VEMAIWDNVVSLGWHLLSETELSLLTII